MKLRAKATPIAAAPPFSPPAAAAVMVSTMAVMAEVSDAVTLMLPFQVVETEPRLALVISAWLVPVMVLKLLAPPPDRPKAPFPTAAEMAAAMDLELMVPLFRELTSTLPVGRTELKLVSSALVLRLMVLLASDTPMEGATLKSEEPMLAAREAPLAVASMVAESVARAVRLVLLRLAVLPLMELPLMVALVLVAMTLVASLPAPLRAKPVPLEAEATAAETATTDASIVAVWEASAARTPAMLSVFRPLPAGPEITALIRFPAPLFEIEGLPPETPGFPWLAPMKLREMLTPTLAAPALPLPVPAPAAEMAKILASIEPAALTLTLRFPALVMDGVSMEALVSPKIVL